MGLGFAVKISFFLDILQVVRHKEQGESKACARMKGAQGMHWNDGVCGGWSVYFATRVCTGMRGT